MDNEELRETVLKEVTGHPILKDFNISVDVDGDEVILLGDVATDDQKWLAQDVASTIFGVLHVTNQLNVTDNRPDYRTTEEMRLNIDTSLS